MTDGRPGPTGASAEERIRAADWSGTAMGPAEDWPASLRIALSICLSSRFPMLVWWGPQLTVFYNDAYLPLLGTKHPTALGRPAAEVWAEAWGDLGPLAAQVLTGGGALLQGMCDVAEQQMNCQARNGLPLGIAGLPDEINDAAWCVAAGLSMYSAKLKTRKEWKRTVPGILGLLYDKNASGGQHGGN